MRKVFIFFIYIFLQCTSKYIYGNGRLSIIVIIFSFFFLLKKKQKYIYFLDNETINSKTIIYCCYKGLINSWMCAIFGSSFVYILDNRLISLNSEYKLDMYFFFLLFFSCVYVVLFIIYKRGTCRYPFMDIVQTRWVRDIFGYIFEKTFNKS